jgi:hypothetical protein
MSKKADPAPSPGDRVRGETLKAFEAFRIYLELGPGRSTAKVGSKLGHRSGKQSEKWSARWSWVERAKAWDEGLAGVADEAHAEVVRRRSREQARIAALHGDVTEIVGQEILERIATAKEEGKDPLKELSIAELLQLEATMIRAHARAVPTERLALGVTTEQPGEALPRTAAEEAAARLSPEELERRLAGVDEVAERRKRRAKTAKAASS